MFPFNDHTRDRLSAALSDLDVQTKDASGLKRAAVNLILLEQQGETAILLTRRTSKMRTNPGQWALPGGRVDPGESILEAAFRELKEEVNLDADESHIIGYLDDYPTRTGYIISPLVLWLSDCRSLKANPDEVASLHPTLITAFDRADSPELIDIPESDQPVLRLHFDDSNVHAPTAAPLYQFVHLALTGSVIRVAHFEQPVWAWK